MIRWKSGLAEQLSLCDTRDPNRRGCARRKSNCLAIRRHTLICQPTDDQSSLAAACISCQPRSQVAVAKSAVVSHRRGDHKRNAAIASATPAAAACRLQSTTNSHHCTRSQASVIAAAAATSCCRRTALGTAAAVHLLGGSAAEWQAEACWQQHTHFCWAAFCSHAQHQRQCSTWRDGYNRSCQAAGELVMSWVGWLVRCRLSNVPIIGCQPRCSSRCTSYVAAAQQSVSFLHPNQLHSSTTAACLLVVLWLLCVLTPLPHDNMAV